MTAVLVMAGGIALTAAIEFVIAPRINAWAARRAERKQIADWWQRR